MLHTLIARIHANANARSTRREDEPVLRFLSSLPQDREYVYLEAGSGVGRFASIVQGTWNSWSIDCLDISPELVALTAQKGLRSTVSSLTSIPCKDAQFDIVHCSHVLEHFGYPAVVTALDELMRVLKPSGYLIIRTPLAHSKFYTDIDHVRPYPPESILHYFRNIQQQKKSSCVVRETIRWYRREWTGIHAFPDVKLISYINLLLKALWLCFTFPRSKPNGYVLILQKLSSTL